MNKSIVMICTIGLLLAGVSALADISICDMNQGGYEPGTVVTVTGICTVPTQRYGGYLTTLTQDGGGPWCSTGIYDQEQTLIAELGQCVTITGTINDYYGRTEVILESIDSIWDCGWQIPDPIRVAPPVDMESLLYCTVVLEGLTVTTDPDQYGIFNLVDTYGTTWPGLLRQIDPPFEVGTEICSFTGTLDYAFDEYRVRNINDESADMRGFEQCPWLGTACDNVTIRQFLSPPSQSCFQPADPFHYTVTWTNLCHSRAAELLIALEVDGLYFFFPAWDEFYTSNTTNLPELRSVYIDIFDFIYPGSAVELNCRLYAIALDSGTFDLISDIDSIEFCLQ